MKNPSIAHFGSLQLEKNRLDLLSRQLLLQEQLAQKLREKELLAQKLREKELLKQELYIFDRRLERLNLEEPEMSKQIKELERGEVRAGSVAAEPMWQDLQELERGLVNLKAEKQAILKAQQQHQERGKELQESGQELHSCQLSWQELQELQELQKELQKEQQKLEEQWAQKLREQEEQLAQKLREQEEQEEQLAQNLREQELWNEKLHMLDQSLETLKLKYDETVRQKLQLEYGEAGAVGSMSQELVELRDLSSKLWHEHWEMRGVKRQYQKSLEKLKNELKELQEKLQEQHELKELRVQQEQEQLKQELHERDLWLKTQERQIESLQQMKEAGAASPVPPERVTLWELYEKYITQQKSEYSQALTVHKLQQERLQELQEKLLLQLGQEKQLLLQEQELLTQDLHNYALSLESTEQEKEETLQKLEEAKKAAMWSTSQEPFNLQHQLLKHMEYLEVKKTVILAVDKLKHERLQELQELQELLKPEEKLQEKLQKLQEDMLLLQQQREALKGKMLLLQQQREALKEEEKQQTLDGVDLAVLDNLPSLDPSALAEAQQSEQKDLQQELLTEGLPGDLAPPMGVFSADPA